MYVLLNTHNNNNIASKSINRVANSPKNRKSKRKVIDKLVVPERATRSVKVKPLEPKTLIRTDTLEVGAGKLVRVVDKLVKVILSLRPSGMG